MHILINAGNFPTTISKRRSEKSERKLHGLHPETMLDRIALVLLIIGGINWGLFGLFEFDLVAWICGGAYPLAARIIYTLVGLCALWCVTLLFRREWHPALAE